MTVKTSSERMGDAVLRARRHWQTTSAATPTAAAPVPPPRRPTIAISRQAGAGGHTVALVLAERLGWPVYDSQLLQLIAQEMGVREELLASMDEKRRGWLQEFLESFSAAPHVNQAFVRQLAAMLLSLAAHGNCIIVGRGAAQILPAETTLRVRLVAPLAARIAAMQKKFALSAAEARAWVEKTDAERNQFVHDWFRKDPNQPDLYDLMLNTSRFPPAACAELIVEALHHLPCLAPARTGVEV